MEAKQIFLLAQFDEASNRRLAALADPLRQAGFIGRQTPGLPFHFTLGSFDASLEAQVLRRTEAVTRRTDAFSVSMSHIGLFGKSVLFAAPALSSALIDLYETLIPEMVLGGVSDLSAHATLLIDEPEAIFRALPMVADAFTPFAAKIVSVGAYRLFPAEPLGTFPLKDE